MSKPQWICAVCAEDFTRKSSAKRHSNNINIHHEKPNIVRYIDYIIARVKGDCPKPIIPPRLRMRNTNKVHKPHKPMFTHDYHNALDARAISRREFDPISQLNVSQSVTKDVDSKNSSADSDVLGQQLSNSNYKLQRWPGGGSQTTLQSKFEEIEKLLSSIRSSENVHAILASLAKQVVYDGGNDNVLELFLTKIRPIINRLQAFDYLLPPKSSTDTNTSEHGTSQLSSRSPFQDVAVDEAAAKKLEQIRLVLTPHCPPQFVMRVITDLTIEFNNTRDYTFLDEAFERHCANIRRRPMRQ